jgi:hypothetical protein
MNFEINLMNSKEYLTSYMWYFVPNVGDKLSLDENKVVTVVERLLPTTNSNRVVLFVEPFEED